MSAALNPEEHLDGSGSRTGPALRTEALEQLLAERGLVDPTVSDTFVAIYETAVGPLAGAEAPPSADGELVFAERWEARLVATTVRLHDAGLFAWPQFQAALVVRIAAWEEHHPGGEGWSYYVQWLDALEDVLAGDGTVFTDEVVQRAAELAMSASHHELHDGGPGH